MLAWRLRREERAGCTQPDDRRATRALAVCFAALAVSVAVGAVHALVTHEVPSTSALGIGVTTAALIAMPVLARAKRRVAPALGARRSGRPARPTCVPCWLVSCSSDFCCGRHSAGGGPTRSRRWSLRVSPPSRSVAAGGRRRSRTPAAAERAQRRRLTLGEEDLPDRDARLMVLAHQAVGPWVRTTTSGAQHAIGGSMRARLHGQRVEVSDAPVAPAPQVQVAPTQSPDEPRYVAPDRYGLRVA